MPANDLEVQERFGDESNRQSETKLRQPTAKKWGKKAKMKSQFHFDDDVISKSILNKY